MSRKLKPVFSKLSNKYDLTEKEIAEIVASPYLFTKETIDELKLDNVSEEEFKDLKTNFMYKYIGKLHTNYKIVHYGKKKIDILKTLKNK